MIFYIFEDKEDSPLSVLFRKAYPAKSQKNFRYTEGAGKIPRELLKVDRIIETSTDLNCEGIIVFLDTVPDNKETVELFLRLERDARLRAKVGKVPLVIIPIICAEYYFLKAFINMGIVQDKFMDIDKEQSISAKQLVQDCINFKAYKRTQISFEAYCKLVLKSALVACATAKTGLGQYFYTNDCMPTCDNDCAVSDYLGLVDKSLYYLRAYPCIPSVAEDKRDLYKAEAVMTDEIIKICRMQFDMLYTQLCKSEPWNILSFSSINIKS